MGFGLEEDFPEVRRGVGRALAWMASTGEASCGGASRLLRKTPASSGKRRLRCTKQEGKGSPRCARVREKGWNKREERGTTESTGMW